MMKAPGLQVGPIRWMTLMILDGPGSWNGYFGRNQFNAQQEIYYKVSDDGNYIIGHPYSPDTTDLNRKGAGLLAGVRVLEWKQILIEDVVFILHEIQMMAHMITIKYHFPCG
ncbi:MAG: hypothetical protein Ct9H300mP9_2870 [Candidatus Neomarinimicrobiota bacterium]|nr:MAG: hypothetical protein Ct9H300mP9_2870 [Candidatus Neomarinimicrobiota bacterium]